MVLLILIPTVSIFYFNKYNTFPSYHVYSLVSV